MTPFLPPAIHRWAFNDRHPLTIPEPSTRYDSLFPTSYCILHLLLSYKNSHKRHSSALYSFPTIPQLALHMMLALQTFFSFLIDPHSRQRASCYRGLPSTVLRIHDILVWIRIRGSMPLTNGSGSGWGFGSGCGSASSYFRHWPSRGQQKTNFLKSFSAFYFLKVHLHHFPKIKSEKDVTKQKESRFFLLFLLDDRRMQEAQKHSDPKGSGFGSGSATLLKPMWSWCFTGPSPCYPLTPLPPALCPLTFITARHFFHT